MKSLFVLAALLVFSVFSASSGLARTALWLTTTQSDVALTEAAHKAVAKKMEALDKAKKEAAVKKIAMKAKKKAKAVEKKEKKK